MVSRLQGLLRAPVLIAIIALAIGLVIGVTLTSGPGPQRPARAATASADCVVRYAVSAQWNTGFTAALTITNAGSPITGWTLQYTFAGNQQLAQGWSGSWSQQGAGVTVTSESWNGTLATGASAQIGANFSYSGDNPAPGAFRVNGAACTAAGTGPLPPAAAPPSSPASPASSSPAASASPAVPAATGAPQLQVSGTALVSASGTPVVLHGVNRDGTEFACVQGTGIFDGPSDQASVTAMQSFGVTAVRIPLNEACWNGQAYVNRRFAGARYQAAIENYVSLLNENGIVAILDLAWTDGAYGGPGTACASARATCPKPMPDAAQAVPFWRSVARAFRGNDAVLLDLFSAPFPDQPAGGSTAAAWQCWLHGGACPGISYPVAGMQTLVSVVRGTGANNVILLGGLGRADDLTQWVASEPADPDHDLAASWHTYNTSPCSNQGCWSSQVTPVMAAAPVITSEIGENDCADTYIGPLMSWLDSAQGGYLAGAWNADFSCATGPSLITSYDGTPTAYGAGFETHIASLAG
jgi:endoglucanase